LLEKLVNQLKSNDFHAVDQIFNGVKKLIIVTMNSKVKMNQRRMRSRRTHATAKLGNKPRLIVFKSQKAIYAQIIDDKTGKVVCGTSSLKGKTGISGAAEVGKDIAELAETKKIKSISFDRNGYQYHGRVKALADAARKSGLEF